MSSQKDRTFKSALKGFTNELSRKDLEKVRKNPNVKYVEQDQVMKISATQYTAPWGLDRIDQSGIPLSGSFTYETTGATVDAYVFDTGIRTDHNEFTGRVRPGFNAIANTTTLLLHTSDAADKLQLFLLAVFSYSIIHKSLTS